jgi:hypothetical protein
MPVEYISRKCQKYYLHQGTTKTGKPKYFFSMKDKGTLVETIPEGYEIYENPNAQVFLRRVQPKILSDEEVAIVEKGMKKFSNLEYYKIDVKKDIISVYLPDQNVNALTEIFTSSTVARVTDVETALTQSITYSPMLRFLLIGENKRIFITQRYCFLGSVDDWIDIGTPDTLQNLVEKYVKHLGKDSYYELH